MDYWVAAIEDTKLSFTQLGQSLEKKFTRGKSKLHSDVPLGLSHVSVLSIHYR